MTTIRTTAAALLLAGFGAMGCATKGYVREQVQAAMDTSRVDWVAGDSLVRTEARRELATVRSDLDSLETDVSALRRDFDVLRDSVGARIVALEHGVQFVFPVTFAFDDATVEDDDRQVLDRFVKVVNAHYQGATVTVEGFADPAGTEAYNRRLSMERAENVIAYLHDAGISGVTLRPVGMGETRQVVDGAMRDMPGAEANRRVVFVVESTDRRALQALR